MSFVNPSELDLEIISAQNKIDFSNFNFSCIYEKKVVPLHDFCTQRDETNYATRQVDETI